MLLQSKTTEMLAFSGFVVAHLWFDAPINRSVPWSRTVELLSPLTDKPLCATWRS